MSRETRAIQVAIVSSILGVVTKTVVGAITGSMTMISSAVDSAGDLIISIKPDGTVFVGQDWIPDRNLATYLKAEHDKNPARNVMLKADKRINFGKVRAVMKAANDAEFTAVAIMTQNQQAGSQIAQGRM